ncbi:hypothetical protein C882_0241 [Caenispirillum salinarum AK4]|uniref:Uncharacterized protein n=1 Tax=Caenispirillum salinarum AK4 TaxID=1238182 RepID=K9HMP3_9PROT|nr:hypothetical protein [Caenispirillum salinarum]EKV29811.1 hypothetical protein C882_0241 [Caenispirillum salinarum AK4]
MLNTHFRALRAARSGLSALEFIDRHRLPVWDTLLLEAGLLERCSVDLLADLCDVLDVAPTDMMPALAGTVDGPDRDALFAADPARLESLGLIQPPLPCTATLHFSNGFRLACHLPEDDGRALVTRYQAAATAGANGSGFFGFDIGPCRYVVNARHVASIRLAHDTEWSANAYDGLPAAGGAPLAVMQAGDRAPALVDAAWDDTGETALADSLDGLPTGSAAPFAIACGREAGDVMVVNPTHLALMVAHVHTLSPVLRDLIAAGPDAADLALSA